ncbi:unnamed protein product, partial [Rotaria magnacalcarata]
MKFSPDEGRSPSDTNHLGSYCAH